MLLCPAEPSQPAHCCDVKSEQAIYQEGKARIIPGMIVIASASNLMLNLTLAVTRFRLHTTDAGRLGIASLIFMAATGERLVTSLAVW